jgi:CBS domain containing-hemolysin-like protein
MKEAAVDWLGHPLTLTLAAAILLVLFSVLEILLRSLAEIGNVRFQGMLDEHRSLLPVNGDASVHLSRLLDVLRWLQIATVGVLWLVLVPMPGVDRALALGLCVGAPALLVVLSRTVVGPLGEDAMARLLWLLKPLLWPPVSLLVRLKPAPPSPDPEAEEEEASDREIQAYLEAGHAAGIFEREETEFVESLVEFFDTVVREVMTPRTEMIAVPEQASVQEVMETISTSHKSRIPVYQETVDRVIGVVHVKNLVKYALGEGQPPLGELVAECMVVPESKRLGELLRDFQQHNQQLAIVVDEYGGTSGLVTLEDILEEIVGEIHDEHELAEPPECEEIEPGVYRLLGRASLEVLEEVFGIEVHEDDVDTVGGLVFSRYGTVPEAGAEVADPSHGLEFTVDEVQERRIVSVTVRRSQVAGPPAADSGSGA